MPPRLRTRLLTFATVATLGIAVHVAASPAAAAPSFFVGTDENALLSGNSQQVASVARALGLRSVRISLQWQPGQTQVPAATQLALTQLSLDSWGLRVVVSIEGRAQDAPRTVGARTQYCSYVADLFRDNPEINDVVIWNDPNDGGFWMPQFGPNGDSIAPGDYESLLAACYDAAHAVRSGANVIAATVSKSSDTPGAFTLAWHPPASWFSKLGAAYSASQRTKPIFDTLGYTPHPATSTERPWTKHPGAATIALGDYAVLMQVLGAAFGGTGQPVPGQGSTRIWYLAQGYQTKADPGRTGFTGTETDPDPLPSWSPQEASDPRSGPGVDQPLQIEDAIRVAYCQPAVGAYFSFHLYDERDLAGWQSGVFWPDGQPKASYQALRQVASEVNARAVNCSAFSAEGAPPRPAAVKQPAQQQLRIVDLRTTTVSAFRAGVAWRTTIPADVQVSYGLVDFGVPTVWSTATSTADGSAATLPALDSSTAYRVWVTAVSDDGQRTQTTLDFKTPGIPSHPAVGTDRTAGAVLLDGMPYFPMMLYSVCPYQYPAALASGINLFALNACGTFQAQLNALGGAAFSAGVAGGHGGTGDGIIGWFHRDEPDGDNVPAAALPGPPPGVPSLSFLTLTNHFYSGAAALPWGRGIYPSLIAKADVIGFDLYPLQEWCRPERMADVFYAQRELVALSGGKPTFQWIEANDWKCGGANSVTPATVRAESWLAIAGGAHGLGYWPASWDTGTSRVIAGIGRDVARLGPVVYVPGQAAASGRIQLSVRTRAGALYVFAVNSSWTAVNAKMSIPALNGRPLSVMGEGRRVNSIGDTFTDRFAPMAVHLYIAAPVGL
ncbi:MAG: hypothetical protein ACM3QU_04065 [Verrucomicrobiota bacterium]